MTFVFENEGVPYLKLCLDLSLYFVGSAFDHIEGILDFYEQSLEILKPDIVQYETGTMSRPRRVKDDTFSILPLWLKNPRAKQDLMMLRLDNSTTVDSAADKAFQFVSFEPKKAGALRLVLPTAFVSQSASPLVDLARSLARKLRFSSGLGGHSLNWNSLGDLANDAEQEILIVSRRYPGIDIPDLAGDVRVIQNGLKCINWLTLLNLDYCGRLGGVDKLRSTLGNQIPVYSIDNGVIIQAGPRPEVGDVNRRATLPFYRKVGRALAGLRAKDHFSFVPSEDPEEDATSEWLARFDS